MFFLFTSSVWGVIGKEDLCYLGTIRTNTRGLPKDLTNNKQRGKFWEKIKDIVVRRLHILKKGVNPMWYVHIIIDYPMMRKWELKDIKEWYWNNIYDRHAAHPPCIWSTQPICIGFMLLIIYMEFIEVLVSTCRRWHKIYWFLLDTSMVYICIYIY